MQIGSLMVLYETGAGEVTNDLLANLVEALKEAPDSNFQRWLSNQVDLWTRPLSTFQLFSKVPSTSYPTPLT